MDRASSTQKMLVALTLSLAVLNYARPAAAQCIVTVAGPLSIDGTPATAQQLAAAYSAVADPANGGYIVSDFAGSTLRRIWPNGTMTTITGIWRNPGLSANGAVVGNTSLLNGPAGIISDGNNGYLFAERGNALVWRLHSNGDGPATTVTLVGPTGLSLDSRNGGVWIADTSGHAIRFVGNDSVMTRVAGTGLPGYSGDNGPALSAQLNSPLGVLADGNGGAWVTDTFNNVIRRIWPNFTITTVAGNTSSLYFGNGILAELAVLASPSGIASDNAGGIIFADATNCVLRRISFSGIISLFAGAPRVCLFSTSNRFGNNIRDINPDLNGTGFVVGDQSTNTIYRVTANGSMSVIAGVGVSFGGNPNANGGPGTSTRFNRPSVVLPESSSSLVILDSANHALRRFFTNNYTMAPVIAGLSGTSAFSGDGGPATNARLSNPSGLASAANAPDGKGGWLICDTNNNRVRRVFANRTIVTVVGNGTATLGGDGLPATMTALNAPSGVSTYDNYGTFYVADTLNRVVRRIYQNGTAVVVAGVLGSAGNSLNQLNFPRALTLDGDNLMIADSGSHAVRVLYPNKTLSVLAGVLGTSGYTGDGGLAKLARLNNVYSSVPDGLGGWLISDLNNNVVRRQSTSAVITTAFFKGNGYTGDGGRPSDARAGNPAYVYVDTNTTWILEASNNALRRVLPPEQCILPSMSQLVGCTAPVASMVTCSFSALAMVPPIFAWLGNVSCNTTVHPGPQNGGFASVDCRLRDPFFVGNITWQTQLGIASTMIVVGTSSQTTTPSLSQTPTGTPTGTSTGTAFATSSCTISPTLTQSLSAAALTVSSTPTQSQAASLTQTGTQVATPSQAESSTQSASRSPLVAALPSASQAASLTQTGTHTVTLSQVASLTQSTSRQVAGTMGLSNSQTTSIVSTPSPSTSSIQNASVSLASSISQTPSSTGTPSVTQGATGTQLGSPRESSSQISSLSFSASVSSGPVATATRAALLSSNDTSSETSSVSPHELSVTQSGSLMPTPRSSSTGSPSMSVEQSTYSMSSTETSNRLFASSSQAPSLSGAMRATTSSRVQPSSAAPSSVSSSASNSPISSRSLRASISDSVLATPTMTEVLASASAMCILLEVPLQVVLVGGISPAAITSPDIGVQLRLGLSCHLGLPLANVQIYSVASHMSNMSAPLPSTAPLAVRADDPVNTQAGPCPSNQSESQLRRLQGANVSPLQTVVYLKVLSCADVDSDSSYIITPTLRSLLLSLNNSATGNSPQMSPSSRVLASFISALAAASSMSPTDIAGTIAVGPSSRVYPSTSSRSGDVQVDNTIPIVIGVICGVLVFCALLFVLWWHLSRNVRAGGKDTALTVAVPKDIVYADTATATSPSSQRFSSGVNPVFLLASPGRALNAARLGKGGVSSRVKSGSARPAAQTHQPKTVAIENGQESTDFSVNNPIPTVLQS